MNSKECSLVAFRFFVLIPPIVARSLSKAQVPGLIDATCQKTPFPTFCSWELGHSFSSATAKNPADLGVIMLDKVDSNAQSAITKINEMLAHAKDPTVKEALSGCNAGYISTASQWVPFSSDSFASNDTRLAYQYMSDAARAAINCSYGLRGMGPLPFTEENDYAYKSAIVCAAIAESLLLSRVAP